MININLTIPYEYSALISAAEMLSKVAADLGETAPAATVAPTLAAPAAPVAVAAPAPALIAAPAPVAVAAPATVASAVFDTPTPIGDAPTAAEPISDLDDEFFPHDERIHSRGQTKNNDGTWKLKRSVDPALVAQVRAETAAPQAVAEPAVVAPVAAVAVAPVAAAVVAPVAPVAEVAAPAPAAVVITFPELAKRITAAGYSNDQLTHVLNQHGVQSYPLLASQPDLVPAIFAALFPEG